ncbi:Sphingolipid hydroxylase [Ceraceosorus bombacis]|uniref:Sphingolipid hydroxylase n=1 Tax=Ceraceosorus bombacis TaxID=401625 RepID=A0A0P1BK34_9BASI|nr:Sphingolipid hydroxylase [Ceraceosorus bombacis]
MSTTVQVVVPPVAGHTRKPATLKSEWRKRDPKTWTFAQRFFERADLWPLPPEGTAPVHKINDPVPRLAQRQIHRFLVPKLLVTFGLHALILKLIKKRALHPLAAFAFYSGAFKAINSRVFNFWRVLGAKHGFLDGEHERDGVPDGHESKVAQSLLLVTTIRPVLSTFLAYNTRDQPFSISKLIPFKLSIYTVALDYWFYVYHRLMHEVDFLWKFHSRHHKTKHPSTALTLYADEWQELFDAVVIPGLAYLTTKQFISLNFYEFFVVMIYQTFIELGGHSGVRCYATPPNACFGLLRFFKMDLDIEAHDLHHRRGYKKSGNYGKQTLVWDTLFGTKMPRDETRDEHIEWNQHVGAPWF